MKGTSSSSRGCLILLEIVVNSKVEAIPSLFLVARIIFVVVVFCFCKVRINIWNEVSWLFLMIELATFY